MAKQSYEIPKNNPNANMSVIFFILWLVNALIIGLANLFFPSQVVLGTASTSYLMALLLSSGVLAWFATLTMPIFTEIEMRKKMVLSPHHWMLGYLAINLISVWILARFADVIGLGLASFFAVLGLALVLDMAQGMSMMAYGEMQKKK